MLAPLLMRFMICRPSITNRLSRSVTDSFPLEYLATAALVCSAILHYTRLHENLNIAGIRKMELVLKFADEAQLWVSSK
jgi:hypothetical protein